MFDIGFMELVLVSIIGLLVLGPQRLPKVAAEIGKWVGRARRTATQLRRQLEREIELSELEKPLATTATAVTAGTTTGGAVGRGTAGPGYPRRPAGDRCVGTVSRLRVRLEHRAEQTPPS